MGNIHEFDEKLGKMEENPRLDNKKITQFSV